MIFCRLKNDLYTKLYNHKDKVKNLYKNGVYKINCKDCDSIYIGETKRPFIKRLKEHKSYVKKKEKQFPVSNHYLTTGHQIDWDNSKIISSEDCTLSRKIKEALEIRQYGAQSLMNFDRGMQLNRNWSLSPS